MRCITVCAVALASIALRAIPAVCDDSISRIPAAGNSVPLVYWTLFGDPQSSGFDARWFFKPANDHLKQWQNDALFLGLAPPTTNAVGPFGCLSGCESSYSNSSINARIEFAHGGGRAFFEGGVGQSRFLSWTDSTSVTWNVGVGIEFQLSPNATIWARGYRSASIGCGWQCMGASPLLVRSDERSVIAGFSWNLWELSFPAKGRGPGPHEWDDDKELSKFWKRIFDFLFPGGDVPPPHKWDENK
jgi:hypothetical protein